MHRIGKYTASIYLDIFTASGGILAAFSISSVLLIASPSPNMSAIFKHVCCAALLLSCLRLLSGCLPLGLSLAARAGYVSFAAVGRGRPPALAGAGRPQALISASLSDQGTIRLLRMTLLWPFHTTSVRLE